LHVLREIDARAARRDAPPQTADAAVATLQAVAPDAAPRRSAGLNALLVDDSAIALRYLQLRLERLGMHTDLAQGSARALELLAQRAYGFVFLDVELGEASALDGLALCQHIKRAHRHVEGRPPSLVLVSAHHGEIDRARGAFAGCDHYLAKPVDDEALRVVLSQRRPKAAPRAERR
jgi:CheY-like chemotaxis protein